MQHYFLWCGVHLDAAMACVWCGMLYCLGVGTVCVRAWVRGGACALKDMPAHACMHVDISVLHVRVLSMLGKATHLEGKPHRPCSLGSWTAVRNSRGPFWLVVRTVVGALGNGRMRRCPPCVTQIGQGG